MSSKSTLISICVLIGLLTIITQNIPFFWDMAHFSQIADHFYTNGFGKYIVPLNMDEGPFPFWGVYLAACWKLFGKSLLVSHLAMLPFILGTFLGFYKLCKSFLNDTFTSVALVLLLLEPTVGTQSLLMSYDIALLCFFLLAVNALMRGKKILYAIALVFIGVCNVRGPVVVGSLFIIQWLFAHRQSNLKYWAWSALYYLPCVIILSAWFLFHKS